MDGSGNGFTLVASGTAVAVGKVGSARSTNGLSNQAGDIISTFFPAGNSLVFPGPANKLTISVWIYANAFGTNNLQDFVETTNSCGGGGNTGAFGFYDNGSGANCTNPGIAVCYHGLNGITQYSTAAEPTAGVWHHYVAQYNLLANPEVTALYIDNVAQNISVCPTFNHPNASDTFVSANLFVMQRTGGFGILPQAGTAGKIDDLRIYGSLLSPGQIQQIYSSEN